MMNIKTLTTASDLAGVLLSQGVCVEAAGGTPLSKLNRSLLGAGLGVLTGVTQGDKEERLAFDPSWAAMMVDQAHVTLPGGVPNEYQATLGTLIEEFSQSVAGTVAFARNVVNPIIKDVCDKISEALDMAGRGGAIAHNDRGARFALSNGSLVVNIMEEGPNPIYLDAPVEQTVNQRLRVPFVNARSPVSYPLMSSVELMEFLENNSKSEFQKDLVDYLKGLELGYDILLNAYLSAYCFQPGRVTGVSINDLRNDMTDRPLIILALGLALCEDIPEGTAGSATNLEKAIVDWVSQVKNIISLNIEVYKQSLANKTIVMNSFTNNFETNVMVNKENYRIYLEEGGTTEALLGCVFSDRDFDPDNLMQRQPEYEEEYERRVAEAASFNNANRLAIFKNTLRDEVRKNIFEVTEEDIRPVAQAEARKALDILMKGIYINALDCPHETVRRVVCGSLFLGTDAEEILVNIDNLCEKDEGLSVRDAGALVILDYLTKFLVSQMCVSRQG